MKKLFLFLILFLFSTQGYAAIKQREISVSSGFNDRLFEVANGDIPITTHNQFIADTDAEKPTSGLTIGDYLYAIDTGKLYKATDTITWSQVTAGAASWGGITGTLSSQSDLQTALDGKLSSYTETDSIVKAISGIVKSNGTTISSAAAGTDYLTPTGSGTGLTNFPILNQNTNGSSASCTGNSATATKLAATKNINGVAFDGSVDIVPYTSTALATSGIIAVTPGSYSVMTITPSGTCTFNSTGGTAGQQSTFYITTSGGTGYGLTWNTNFKTAGTLNTGTSTGKISTVTYICKDGTTWAELSRTKGM